MRETVKLLWPEIDWIQDPQLREKVTQTWIRALERSPLKTGDLNQIPFTLLVPNCPITFMEADHSASLWQIRSTPTMSSSSPTIWFPFHVSRGKFRVIMSTTL
jgi:hypothetical protein